MNCSSGGEKTDCWSVGRCGQPTKDRSHSPSVGLRIHFQVAVWQAPARRHGTPGASACLCGAFHRPTASPQEGPSSVPRLSGNWLCFTVSLPRLPLPIAEVHPFSQLTAFSLLPLHEEKRSQAPRRRACAFLPGHAAGGLDCMPQDQPSFWLAFLAP